MFAAPSSGSGKTTITMALVRALKKRGYNPSCFKTGPDYIDTAFFSAASGKPAANLDLHLQGRTGLSQALSLANSNSIIVESAMGYFDGIANSWKGSSFEISKELKIPTILIYTPKGEMFSAIPKIKGMVDFSRSLIKAVILNRVNHSMFLMLKEKIEEYASLPVIGYMPEVQESQLKSRHLGLIQSMEIDQLDKQIALLANNAEKYIDIKAILSFLSEVENTPFPQLGSRKLKVAIARDKAFSFYYQENLKLFENTCEVNYFSPLCDYQLPKCDLLYLGGGYPEIFIDELSGNRKMMESIRNYAFNGGCVFAECGGLIYICDNFEQRKMVGILKGDCRMTPKLKRFGYVDVTLLDDCMLGKAGAVLSAHEFHHSECSIAMPKIFSVRKTMGKRYWGCGYRYKNVLAGYPHLNFLGNLDAFEHMLNYTERNC